jgi:hypothetical protein
MSTTTVDVAGYAAAVRAALADLDPEQVEDLTDGLEANLADALVDADRRRPGCRADEVFGPPAEYAIELRSAAGMNVQAADRRRRRLGEVLTAPFRALSASAQRVLERLRGQRWWPPVEDFLVTLRPAWWVLRGWVLWRIVTGLSGDGHAMPATFVSLLVLVAIIVASAQWGRGRWHTRGVPQRLATVLSAVAVVAALPLLATSSPSEVQPVYAADSPPSDGVVVDGQQATNLFVYDGEGRPVERAQVYDQDGRAVLTQPHGFQAGGVWYSFARPTGGDQPRWNIYPLLSAPATAWTVDDKNQPVLAPGVVPSAPGPFAQAPALAATPAPTPSAVSTDPATTGSPTGPATAPATTGPTPAATVPATATSAPAATAAAPAQPPSAAATP